MMKNNIKYTMNRPVSSFSFYSGIIAFFLLITVQITIAGNIRVSGKVYDEGTKLPLNAARISVVGDNGIAISDEKGSFTVTAEKENVLLNISAFGYQSRFISARNGDDLKIGLYPDVFTSLFDIRSLNASVSVGEQAFSNTIAADEIIHDVFAGNLRTASRSGNKGIGSALFLRGLNSIHLNAQPLFVVDGAIRENLYEVNSIHAGFFNNPLSLIETGDIENIQLLKDGTGIYGGRASNGVILINTRRSRDMVTRIDLNISTGFSLAPPTLPVLDNAEYRIYLTELLSTSGMSAFEVQQLPYMNDDKKRYTYNRYHNNTNWAETTYQTGVNNNYNISVNGGDEKALYYFALGYTNNEGVVKSNDYQRYNMRLNADINLTEKLSTGLNIGFSRSDRNLLDDGVQDYTSPTWLSLIKAPFLHPNTYTFTGELTSEIDYFDILNAGNPLGIIEKSINTVKQTGFTLGINPTLKINQKWTIRAMFDYYLNKITEDYYRPYLYTAPVFLEGIGLSENARLSQVMRNTSVSGEVMAHYKPEINRDTKIQLNFGTRFRYNNFEADYAEGHNSKSNSTINLNRNNFQHLLVDGVNDVTKTMSHYVQADILHDTRYALNASLSLDASSRFGNSTNGGLKLFRQNMGVFPAVQGAWILSAEDFMKDLKNINQLKLRAGYSISGNDQIPVYQNKAYFGNVKLSGVAGGLVLSGLENPGIKWETSYRATVGMDGSVLNDRVSFMLDFFASTTDDLIVMKNLPEHTGLSYYWKNSGKLSNVGGELVLQIKVLNTKDFQWELTSSAGHYKNKLISLPEGSFVTKVMGGEVISEVGKPAGLFYGYKTLGVFSTESEALNSGLKTYNPQGELVNFGAGDVHFADIQKNGNNADGIINEQDKQVIGDPNPDFYGSVGSTFKFGDLSVQALFTYSVGNEIYNYQRQMLESMSSYHNQSGAVLARWTSEGQITNIPKAVFGDPPGNSRFSDRWIEDGSYIRFKSLTASYNIPLKIKFIEGMKVWASAENLFTVSQYLGVDPEVSAGNAVLVQGIDAGYLPALRNFTLGLKINL